MPNTYHKSIQPSVRQRKGDQLVIVRRQAHNLLWGITLTFCALKGFSEHHREGCPISLGLTVTKGWMLSCCSPCRPRVHIPILWGSWWTGLGFLAGSLLNCALKTCCYEADDFWLLGSGWHWLIRPSLAERVTNEDTILFKSHIIRSLLVRTNKWPLCMGHIFQVPAHSVQWKWCLHSTSSSEV